MPLTRNSSHLIHEGITKHTWSPNLDTTRYQATGTATYKRDAFCYGDTADTPHISEYTYQLGDPQEWAGRISSRTIVHTGGCTNMAMYTHHTTTRPKFPPGSVNKGTFTLSRYLPQMSVQGGASIIFLLDKKSGKTLCARAMLCEPIMMAWLPQEDNAVKELHMVVAKVQPAMTDLLQALEMYHLHSADGWITTTGFLACCNKAGLRLQRSEFLALERSVPKDRFGRFNYYHMAEVIEAVGATNVVGNSTTTAPAALETLRLSTIRAGAPASRL